MGMHRGFALGNSVDGVEYGITFRGGEAIGQGLIVSVKGSVVTIENYNFDFSEGPRPLDSVARIPQTWVFDVSKPYDFPYTNVRRNQEKIAPVFDLSQPANSSLEERIQFHKITDSSVKIEFPQAKIPLPNYGNEVVYNYLFEFTNQVTGNIERSVRQWSDFVIHLRLQRPTYTQLIGGLNPNTNYELRIYAYGFYQERSRQLLLSSFKTLNFFEE